MIPTLEDIILGLIDGSMDKDDARVWIHSHFQLNRLPVALPAQEPPSRNIVINGDEFRITFLPDNDCDVVFLGPQPHKGEHREER